MRDKQDNLETSIVYDVCRMSVVCIIVSTLCQINVELCTAHIRTKYSTLLTNISLYLLVSYVIVDPSFYFWAH
jgi:hypothetical protein